MNTPIIRTYTRNEKSSPARLGDEKIILRHRDHETFL